jgi:glycosyltransferase involved in cell wall biosynthesis
MSETRMASAAILVPAYNVEPWGSGFVRRFSEACQEIRSVLELEPCLVFVDDGSYRPGTLLESHAPTFSQLNCRSILARHCINRGQGAAIQTALEIARSPALHAQYFVTFDADGQHDPADATRLLEELRRRNLNIVFGNRFDRSTLKSTGMPRARHLLLRVAGLFDRLVTGMNLHDAHNGLRAFDAETAALIRLNQDGMAHATEFKMIIARNRLRYGEFPVRITYTDDTLAQGQGNINAVNIVRELMESLWFQ